MRMCMLKAGSYSISEMFLNELLLERHTSVVKTLGQGFNIALQYIDPMLFKSGTSRQIGRTKFSMTLYSGDDLSQEGSVHYTRPCIPMKINMHAGVKSAHSQIICCPQIGKIVLQHAQTKQRAARAFLMGRSPSGFSYQEVGVEWGVV